MINKTYNLGFTSFIALAGAIIHAPTALAQTQDPAAEDNGGGLEEIVVTAQKREQSLQRVPMSISAISASTLRDAGTVDMKGIANQVPSLAATQNVSPINQSYRIRGIGSDPNIPTFEPDVALFIDGVYMPRTGLGVDDLVDISRVEVLKGPQSTLYGKNATAGVVNVVSARPSRSFEAHFDATLSNIEGGRNAIAGRVAGSISGPLTDGIRARFTGVYYDQGETFRNLDAGAGNANGMQRYALRGQIEIDLGSRATLNLTAARTQVLNSNATNADVYLGNPALYEAGTLADMIDNPANPFHALSALFPGAKGCTDSDATNRVICATTPNRYRGWTNMASATLTADFDFATLTSVSAWSNYKSQTNAQDIDQVSLPLVGYIDSQSGNSFSQELRLVSPSGQTLEWLAGGYYLHTDFNRGDHGRTPTFTLQGAAPYVPMPLPPANLAQLSALGGLLSTGIPAMGVPPLNSLMTGLGIATIDPNLANHTVLGQAGDTGSIDSNAASNYYAAFAQSTFHLNEQFALTGGIRWQTERKTASLNNSSATALNPFYVNALGSLQQLAANAATPAAIAGLVNTQLIPAFTQLAGTNLMAAKLTPGFVNGPLPDVSRDAVTWTGTATFTPTDNAMTYVTVARGYKSGGYNIGFGNAPVTSLAYQPEVVHHLEAGAKFDLLDKRARIDISLFRTNYDNYQSAGFVGLQFLVNNAEKARVKGIEANGAFALAPGLTFNLGATWLDAKFVRYTGGACAYLQTPAANGACDQSGKKLPLTPSVRITSALQYNQAASFGEVYGRLDVAWQSSMTTNSASLDPRSIQSAFALANLRLGARFDGAGLDLSVFANNLFNKTYVQQTAVLNLFSSTPAGTTTSGYQAFLGSPREIGVTLRKKF